MSQPTPSRNDLPPGHVPLPVMLTGSMGLSLAGGLHFFGLLEILDRHLASLVAVEGELMTTAPSTGVLWSMTVAATYGVVFIILEIPATWRRLVIWISTLVVILGWLPVAAIAHTHAKVGAPLVSVAWAGLCAIIYAARHHMETDDPPVSAIGSIETPTPQPDDATD